MANLPSDYIISTADWRKTLRQNNTRTYSIIVIFILIYLGIGIIVDMSLVVNKFPQADLYDLFMLLVTFKQFPIATFVMLGVALMSLLITYSLYDTIMLLGTDYHEVTAKSQKLAEKQLYNIVSEMVIAAGLRYIPKIYIIDADYMNAFASGYSEKSAMLAITQGLLKKLSRDEIQAVMAHELSHIRHLDIKLTLTASVLANLTVIVLDFMFYNMLYSKSDSSDTNAGKNKNILAIIIVTLRYLLPLINIILLLYLSRTRELMADAGSAQLMRTNQPLASALIKIEGDHLSNREEYAEQYSSNAHDYLRRESYIFDPSQAGINTFSSINSLFSTHPSLKQRLNALGIKQSDSKKN